MEKTMSIFDFANKLNGRAYLDEMTKEEELLAKELGFVVLFGYSDDNAEFRGAYDDEVGCFGGGRVYQDGDLFIDACWCSDGADWGYVTNIPRATFDIMQDGEVYCRGIVFEKDPRKNKAEESDSSKENAAKKILDDINLKLCKYLVGSNIVIPADEALRYLNDLYSKYES